MVDVDESSAVFSAPSLPRVVVPASVPSPATVRAPRSERMAPRCRKTPSFFAEGNSTDHMPVGGGFVGCDVLVSSPPAAVLPFEAEVLLAVSGSFLPLQAVSLSWSDCDSAEASSSSGMYLVHAGSTDERINKGYDTTIPHDHFSERKPS